MQRSQQRQKVDGSIRDEIYEELCMITGKTNKDLSYLIYLVLKDGVYFTEEKQEPAKSELAADSLSDWFESI
ncbi:MAG: hypothetical protein IKL53_06265 [Lachnospiraceae bacterium]|nr:hypothetical protein [Lachnospiraceae bacterium]